MLGRVRVRVIAGHIAETWQKLGYRQDLAGNGAKIYPGLGEPGQMATPHRCTDQLPYSGTSLVLDKLKCPPELKA